MPKQSKTPLEQKFLQLPRIIEFVRDILPELTDAGISRRTFERDLKADPKNIPSGRLQFYAGLFNCDLSDLIEPVSKIKPLVKNQLSKKANIKV